MRLLWYDCSSVCELPTQRLYSRTNGHLLQKDLCYTLHLPGLLLLEPVSAAGCCSLMPLQETLKHSKAGLSQSPWGSLLLSLGPGVHMVLFVPSKPLVAVRFDFKPPSYHLAAASLLLVMGYLFLVGFNILLSIVIQQLIAVLESLQGKMRVHPSTPPSWI